MRNVSFMLPLFLAVFVSCSKSSDKEPAPAINSITVEIEAGGLELASVSFDISSYFSNNKDQSGAQMKFATDEDFSGSEWTDLASAYTLVKEPTLLNCTSQLIYLKLKKADGTETDPISYTFQGKCWAALSDVDAPSTRYYHSAVWTGTQMIVFGGDTSTDIIFGNHDICNDGGIYDPSTDTWKNMSSTGAPYRSSHSAVWTGEQMLVFGGFNQNDEKTLFTYNPTTDSWSTLADAPISARRLHTAVWTGTKMIIWGGGDKSCVNSVCEHFFSDGAAYDPATNQWSLISSTNAPSARVGATAVWSGDKMIVWGGYGADASPLANGGIYDPGTDSWTLISSTEIYHARAEHSAVWTGDEMMVWGGLSADNMNTNGKFYFYNPSDDVWRETYELPVSPRRRHSTIWTGTRLMVWGGTPPDYVGSLSSGGSAFTPGLFTNLQQE